MKKKRPVVMFQGKLVPEEDLFYLQDLPVPKSALFVELPAQAMAGLADLLFRIREFMPKE